MLKRKKKATPRTIAFFRKKGGAQERKKEGERRDPDGNKI